MKIVINGRMYVRHRTLGWLMPGSWDWQPVYGPM